MNATWTQIAWVAHYGLIALYAIIIINFIRLKLTKKAETQWIKTNVPEAYNSSESVKVAGLLGFPLAAQLFVYGQYIEAVPVALGLFGFTAAMLAQPQIVFATYSAKAKAAMKSTAHSGGQYSDFAYDAGEQDDEFAYDAGGFSEAPAPRGFEQRDPSDAKLWAIIDDPNANESESMTALKAINKKRSKRNSIVRT